MCNNLDATIAIYLELQVSGFSVKVSENHLDRALSVEISVECQIFVIVIFYNCCRVLQFGAHYKGALTQKRSFLVICTTIRSDFHVG